VRKNLKKEEDNYIRQAIGSARKPFLALRVAICFFFRVVFTVVPVLQY